MEKRHYGSAYDFNGDVEEMQRDFAHYLFRFHDEYVEALCGGIWFETADHPIGNRAPDPDHPLLELPSSREPDRFEAHGITCQIRRNHRPLTDVVRDAQLCSQKLLQFAAELDGSASVSWTLSVQARDGRIRSKLEQRFGRPIVHYDGVAALDDVRPHIEAWLGEVSQRRRTNR
jgi:hypothetical protein